MKGRHFVYLAALLVSSMATSSSWAACPYDPDCLDNPYGAVKPVQTRRAQQSLQSIRKPIQQPILDEPLCDRCTKNS